MRKLKQILCPVIAAAMMLGMTTVGVSAAPTFSDADQIVHVEAVNRAAELGYFVGSGGKFMPRDTVTRAQMATVIVKMLFSADFNANPYKNMGRFPDTANYQGGWADGYINLCAKEGVVGGYGDGTFQPDNKVTAAEAVTMILNAMKVDAGKGNWPDTVMNKGTELGLFAELPGVEANTALNRDQLAALVIAGVDWQDAQDNGVDSDPDGSSGGSGGSSGGSGSSSGGSGSSSGSTSGGSSGSSSGGSSGSSSGGSSGSSSGGSSGSSSGGSSGSSSGSSSGGSTGAGGAYETERDDPPSEQPGNAGGENGSEGNDTSSEQPVGPGGAYETERDDTTPEQPGNADGEAGTEGDDTSSEQPVGPGGKYETERDV